MKRILVAVDHSAPSLRAADFAADMASKLNGELVLLTVARWVESRDPALQDYLRNEHIEDPLGVVIENAARSELQTLRERFVEKLDGNVSYQVVVGEASDKIVSFAKNSKIDLIAIGHVGHGQIAGLLLGSVAKRVIDTAHCPVLVVP